MLATIITGESCDATLLRNRELTTGIQTFPLPGHLEVDYHVRLHVRLPSIDGSATLSLHLIRLDMRDDEHHDRESCSPFHLVLPL